MKIICVGMNYSAHNAELGDTPPVADPVIFLKPETALAREGWPFFMPDFSHQVEYETELVVRINHLGKCIPERFARRYYDEVTVGLDFTLRDVQRDVRTGGLPWEICKGFDGSAHIGRWLRLDDLGGDVQRLKFAMQLNGEARQAGDTSAMLHSVDSIVAYTSRYFTLKTGDLIYTGTPSGVGAVRPGDVITAKLEGQDVLTVKIK